jgi:hypothetical protein
VFLGAAFVGALVAGLARWQEVAQLCDRFAAAPEWSDEHPEAVYGHHAYRLA